MRDFRRSTLASAQRHVTRRQASNLASRSEDGHDAASAEPSALILRMDEALALIALIGSSRSRRIGGGGHRALGSGAFRVVGIRRMRHEPCVDRCLPGEKAGGIPKIVRHRRSTPCGMRFAVRGSWMTFASSKALPHCCWSRKTRHLMMLCQPGQQALISMNQRSGRRSARRAKRQTDQSHFVFQGCACGDSIPRRGALFA